MQEDLKTSNLIERSILEIGWRFVDKTEQYIVWAGRYSLPIKATKWLPYQRVIRTPDDFDISAN
jgi:hypothetical protein